MDPSLFFQKTVSFSKKENEVITIRAFIETINKVNLIYYHYYYFYYYYYYHYYYSTITEHYVAPKCGLVTFHALFPITTQTYQLKIDFIQTYNLKVNLCPLHIAKFAYNQISFVCSFLNS